MDYRNIFESALNEAYDIGRLPDDDGFIRSVKERTVNMEKKKFKMKKPAVIAASIAAAAALTVSVGAAADWDIASLFVQRLGTVKEHHTSLVDNIADFFPEQFGEYRPENAVTDGGERNEYDILQKITHPLDETVEYNGYTVHIYGYAYDGARFVLMYDITYSDEVKELIGENNRRLEEFNEMYRTDEELRKRVDEGDPFRNGYDGFINDPILFRLSNVSEGLYTLGGSTKLAVTEDGRECRREIITDMYDVPENVQLIMDHVTTREKKENVASFDVELSAPDELMLDVETGYTKQLADGRELTVKNIRISPFGVNVYLSVDKFDLNGDNEPIYQVPVYLIYKDGTVIDASGCGNSTMTMFNAQADGSAEPRTYLSSRGNIIDVTEIQAIKLYDTIIEL